MKKTHIVLILAYILSILLTFFIFKPFLSWIILGIVLVMFLYPLNNWIKNYIKNDVTRSLLMTFLTLFLIVLPLWLVIISVSDDARTVYNEVNNLELDALNEYVSNATGLNIDAEKYVVQIAGDITDYLRTNSSNIITIAGDLLLKLFVMFFAIYYLFKDGAKITKNIMELVPFSDKHKKELIDKSRNVVWGILYGQFLVAVIQGIAGGLAFWIFGFQNPIFWGFIMGVLSFIPLLGTPIVFVPAAIIAYLKGDIVPAIGLLTVGIVVISNIDNFIKPKLIGIRAGLHPLTVLVGILGGVALMGPIGFIVGPIILALSLIIIKLFNKEVLVT